MFERKRMKQLGGSLIAGLLLLNTACEKPTEIAPDMEAKKTAPKTAKDGEIVLGKRLANPYSLKTLRQAAQNIGQSAAGVQLTHYYVRFLPADGPEYDRLKSDKSLVLYDIPLDHEIAVNGWHYHDPSIPAGKPTWQYAAVDKNYPFDKGIKYEILEELCLPEEAEDGQKSGMAAKLDNEALRLTGNAPAETSKAQKTAWAPSGRIQVNVFFGNRGIASVEDSVTGYTLPQIEAGFLKKVYGLGSLRDHLQANKPVGVTDEQIARLFDSYNF